MQNLIKPLFLICFFLTACQKPGQNLPIDDDLKQSKGYQKIFNEHQGNEYGELKPLSEKPSEERIIDAYRKADLFILNVTRANLKREMLQQKKPVTIYKTVFTFANTDFDWQAEDQKNLETIVSHYDFEKRSTVVIYTHQTNDVGLVIFEKLVEQGIKPYDILQKPYIGNLQNLSPYSAFVEIDFSE